MKQHKTYLFSILGSNGNLVDFYEASGAMSMDIDVDSSDGKDNENEEGNDIGRIAQHFGFEQIPSTSLVEYGKLVIVMDKEEFDRTKTCLFPKL